MKPINPLRLLLIGLILAVAGWAATVLTNRYSVATPVLPATALATMGVIVAITLILGIRILRWRNSNRDSTKKKTVLNPILAARTLVLAQACAYTGSVLLGWHAGIFVDQLRLWNLRSDQTLAWQALAMAGGGLAMIGVGLMVERFCRIPPEDGEGESAPGRQEQRKPKSEGEYAYRGD